MGLAREQELPGEKKESAGWTIKRLFGGSTVTDSVAKTFKNPFEWLLGFMVIVIGTSEVIGHSVSWVFYGLTLLIFAAALYVHLLPAPILPPKKEVKKQK